MICIGNELEANLYKITSIYLEEVQQIFDEFDKIVLKGSHDIGNCLIIEHVIRLTTDILVVGKMRYYILKKHK